MTTLRQSLEICEPLYVVPQDNVVDSVLIPAFKASTSVECMMGFFTSSSLAEIAPGLATYLARTSTPLKLIVSPFISAADHEAIQSGVLGAGEYTEKLFWNDVPEADALAQHTLSCFAWLIRQGRLQLKFALMKDALFHIKAWIFSDETSNAAFHGSSNMTYKGLKRNREQLTLSRSWRGEEAVFHINRLQREFKDLWSGGDEDCIIVDLPRALAEKIVISYAKEAMPTDDDFKRAWRRAVGLSAPDTEPPPDAAPEFKIPPYLNYATGQFAHQGRAVEEWKKAKWRGVLEMATGSGKTITSMVGVYKLVEEIGPALIVIAAPYRPLIEQWCDEVRLFGLSPVNLTQAAGPKERDQLIKAAARRLSLGTSRAEVLVVSNDTLCTSPFIESLSKSSANKVLIADECHNLGAASFANNPPACFEYRLGLSATPVRQYDEEGTEAIFKYFGDVCFKFTLEEAIGNCLTPYDYHVHFVALSQDEQEKWQELTGKISSASWKIKSGERDAYLDNLIRQRRLVLETAIGKIEALKFQLDARNPQDIRYALIYTTDKDPNQILEVNELLINRGVIFHQLTEKETGNRKETLRILRSFQDGKHQVLTAKRVLDEGVNVPQIKEAFILASTTLQRQWIQRRGRLLRTCSAIGKTHAVIHDFVVIPPLDRFGDDKKNLDEDTRKMVRSELKRVWEFARLAQNGAAVGGPYEAVQRLQNLANELGDLDGV